MPLPYKLNSENVQILAVTIPKTYFTESVDALLGKQTFMHSLMKFTVYIFVMR